MSLCSFLFLCSYIINNRKERKTMDDFRKYATKHLGMNAMVLDDVIKSQAGYLNPYILEERQLNVTQLDVFSRLMMDRIIFLGTQIDDYTANTLQAQLLYLDSVDPGKDISIYINSPGGSVYAGLGIYDTMRVMWLQSVPVWQLLWLLYCWWPVPKANVRRCLTHV